MEGVWEAELPTKSQHSTSIYNQLKENTSYKEVSQRHGISIASKGGVRGECGPDRQYDFFKEDDNKAFVLL